MYVLVASMCFSSGHFNLEDESREDSDSSFEFFDKTTNTTTTNNINDNKTHTIATGDNSMSTHNTTPDAKNDNTSPTIANGDNNDNTTYTTAGAIANDHEDQELAYDLEEQEVTETNDSKLNISGYTKGGNIPVVNRKVFYAERVSIYEHPYMASVRRLSAHYLSAALLTRNVVVSVAHPVADVPTTELRVAYGETYSDRATKLNEVMLIITHYHFDPYTLNADIALLRTYGDITYKNSVKAIPLVSPYFQMIGSKAFVTGWGRCDNTGTELCMPRSSKFFPDEKVDTMLRAIRFNITANNTYCDIYRKLELPLQKGMLCLGLARYENPLSPCLGVPGAPLVVQARLVGLLSWGLGCGFRDDLPLVYTSVKYYAPWILYNVVKLKSIRKDDLTQLFGISKAVVITNWLKETGCTTANLTLWKDKNMKPLAVDNVLVQLIGRVYDVRDSINGGELSNSKQLMYSELIDEQKSLMMWKLTGPVDEPSEGVDWNNTRLAPNWTEIMDDSSEELIDSDTDNIIH